MPRDLSRPPDPAVQHLLDLMRGFAAVRARRMFGGHGLYRDDIMFALLADGDLYLKVDEQSRDVFVKRDLRAFTFSAKGRTVSLSYHEAPAEALEDEAVMAQWCRLAWEAALRSKAPGAGAKRARRSVQPQAKAKPGGAASVSAAQGPDGLQGLPNLGPRSMQWLAAAGITSLVQLQGIGAVRAFVRARACSPSVSLNLLWALEGALTGRRWQDVADTDRASLLMALEDVERELKP